ncbi:hypothetical protein CLAIMM_13066 isoform 1 [Cladophialophora immunda]|nr:hypothetical protein CLAIMM_13066 isoform 1 [Cladophialophora immunda]
MGPCSASSFLLPNKLGTQQTIFSHCSRPCIHHHHLFPLRALAIMHTPGAACPMVRIPRKMIHWMTYLCRAHSRRLSAMQHSHASARMRTGGAGGTREEEETTNTECPSAPRERLARNVMRYRGEKKKEKKKSSYLHLPRTQAPCMHSGGGCCSEWYTPTPFL